jgi:hypothetical protein
MIGKIPNFILAPASVGGIEIIQNAPVEQITPDGETVKLILQLLVTIAYLIQLFKKKGQTT